MTIAPRPHPKVLVVDDVAANRELLQGHLDDLGYDVREAKDGVEALEAVAADEPDLILLDIDMPRLDGIAVCERLKSHPVRRLIPIVILTASNDRDTKLRGIAAGADDYLSKPFDSKELLIRTKVLLRQRALNERLDATDRAQHARPLRNEKRASVARIHVGRDHAVDRSRERSIQPIGQDRFDDGAFKNAVPLFLRSGMLAVRR